MNKLRVGLIDSGLGGKNIGDILKNKFDVDVYQYRHKYFMSYSNITKQGLIEELETHLEYLNNFNIDILIIGCMTLSTNLLDYIHSKVNIPIINMFTILPKLSKDTLVLGTSNTINSRKFKDCTELAVPKISSAIEANRSCLLFSLLQSYELTINRHDLNSCTKVLLACSHYSIEKEQFKQYYKNHTIIDPVDYVIYEFKKVYEQVFKNNTVINRDECLIPNMATAF